MLSRVLAISIAAVATVAAVSPAQAQERVAGSYTVEGSCNGADAYRGTLTVSGHGPVYELTWRIGPDTFRGNALERDGVLAIVYTSANYSGLMQTRRSHHGGWDGIWTVAGQSTVCSEVWTAH